MRTSQLIEMQTAEDQYDGEPHDPKRYQSRIMIVTQNGAAKQRSLHGVVRIGEGMSERSQEEWAGYLEGHTRVPFRRWINQVTDSGTMTPYRVVAGELTSIEPNSIFQCIILCLGDRLNYRIRSAHSL